MHTLWMILIGIALWFATSVAVFMGAESAHPKEVKAGTPRLLFPEPLALLIGVGAATSWALWIGNGWLALIVWVVTGALVGFLGERLCWRRLTPDEKEAWLKRAKEERERKRQIETAKQQQVVDEVRDKALQSSDSLQENFEPQSAAVAPPGTANSSGGADDSGASADPIEIPFAANEPEVWLDNGTTILSFPSNGEARYEEHLKLTGVLKRAGVYPALKVLGLKAIDSSACPRLIVVTGSVEATRQLSRVFHTREAEDFIKRECGGSWEAINPAYSRSNVPDSGCSIDLSAFNDIVFTIRDHYAIDQILG